MKSSPVNRCSSIGLDVVLLPGIVYCSFYANQQIYTQSCVLHIAITCFKADLLKYPLIGESNFYHGRVFFVIPSLSISVGGVLTIRSISSRRFDSNV